MKKDMKIEYLIFFKVICMKGFSVECELLSSSPSKSFLCHPLSWDLIICQTTKMSKSIMKDMTRMRKQSLFFCQPSSFGSRF